MLYFLLPVALGFCCGMATAIGLQLYIRRRQTSGISRSEQSSLQTWRVA